MARDLWNLTFEAQPQLQPPAVRVRHLLEFALRELGLRCVSLDDGAAKVQRGIVEECCRVLCPDCAVGELARLCRKSHSWYHPRKSTLCTAHQLREAMRLGTIRSAKDAESTDDVPALPPAVEGG